LAGVKIMISYSKRGYSIFKSIMKRLYWCPRCNIPLLQDKCSRCVKNKSVTLKVKITPPGDIRPALGRDYFKILDLLKEFLGEKWNNVIPVRNIILLNKIQHIDLADEIIIDGQVIGSRYYDIHSNKWKFRPSYPIVYQMIRKRIGYYAIVEMNFLKRRYEIHKNRIIEYNFPDIKGEYVAVSNHKRNFYGLGILERGKRVKIIKIWRKRPFSWLEKNPTWRDVVEGNLEYLKNIEDEAVRFIKETKEKYNLPVVVSFSGGKDSLATYLLVKKALGKVDLIFNDTGLELPETVNYVKIFAKDEGIRLIYADAGDNFWRSLNVMGPPARDYRWCCKIAKLSPISNSIKKNFPKGALNFVGQRKFESLSRALSPRIWRNKWMSNIIAASPINDWRFLDVWLYIIWKKARINPLYFRGFDRLGCWLCPASQLGELDEIKLEYKELWTKWEKYLKEFAKNKGFGEEWIKYGLWRWIHLPEKIKIYLSRFNIDSSRYDGIRRFGDINIKEDNNKIEVKIIDSLIPFSKERYETFMQTIDKNYKDFIRYDSEKDVFFINNNEQSSLFIKNLIRMMNCVGCGLCIVWCPTNAITIEDNMAVIDVNECISCKNCVKICPIAEYIFSNLS